MRICGGGPSPSIPKVPRGPKFLSEVGGLHGADPKCKFLLQCILVDCFIFDRRILLC